jgi:hypothetical protein
LIVEEFSSVGGILLEPKWLSWLLDVCCGLAFGRMKFDVAKMIEATIAPPLLFAVTSG